MAILKLERCKASFADSIALRLAILDLLARLSLLLGKNVERRIAGPAGGSLQGFPVLRKQKTRHLEQMERALQKDVPRGT